MLFDVNCPRKLQYHLNESTRVYSFLEDLTPFVGPLIPCLVISVLKNCSFLIVSWHPSLFDLHICKYIFKHWWGLRPRSSVAQHNITIATTTNRNPPSPRKSRRGNDVENMRENSSPNNKSILGNQQRATRQFCFYMTVHEEK